MNSNLFEAAPARAAKTWKAYISALCILHLTLLIDSLSGFSFLSGNEPISLGGFKVVREALSLTYGILFTLFIVTAFLESGVLKRSSVGLSPTPSGNSAVDLWFISPFSASRFLRGLFWFFLVDGFLFLAAFSLIHLDGRWPPNPDRMSAKIYTLIGRVDFILFVTCLPFAYLIYRNLRRVRTVMAGK